MLLSNNSDKDVFANYSYRNFAEEQCIPNMSYNTSVPEAESYQYSTGYMLLVTVFLPLTFLVGIISNVAFTYVALRIKHMRTVTNKYLIHLAVSDVIFLTAAIGDKLWKYTGSPVMGDVTPLGSFGCIWVYFISDMAYFASLIFVTIVSLDRYFAVCRPQDRKNVIKGRSTEITILSWVLACILAGSLIPSNANITVYCMLWPDTEPYVNWPSAISFCLPINNWIADFGTGVQTVPFFVTLVLNVYMYVAIIRGLDQCIQRMSQHGVAKSKDTGMRRQIARMLVVNGATFFCLLAPFELGSLFQMIASLRGGDVYLFIITNNTARSYLMLTARTLSYVNSAINPLIYTAMCRRYLEAFKQAFLPSSWRNKLNQDLRMDQSTRVSALPTQTEETKLNPDFNDTNV
ncbi:growth hormone secretagogue receptor type 1-like [Amphiura filiformis]|uniref:growth hormone secretagogue receptor type 1-like n=1 Tax=Amphiura filiformis TaxID=82378 RepID=UPI003B21FCFA